MGDPFYECPVCGRRSHNANDIEQRYCGHCRAYEDEQAPSVKARLRAVASLARDSLWGARGGMQVLTPAQAFEFGKLIGQLDKLIDLLKPPLIETAGQPEKRR